jgi:hypothetical protein
MTNHPFAFLDFYTDPFSIQMDEADPIEAQQSF